MGILINYDAVMYCTDETHLPVTKLHQVVYTANYFNFTSDQTPQCEAQMHMDGDSNDVLIINTLEKTWEKETQPTKVIYFYAVGSWKAILHIHICKDSLCRSS